MDKYEVLGQVGEGSFGQVYKARKRSDGEIVAFKVIRKRGRSVKELKSLRQECEIQRRLHHPNIVRMLDSFETENESNDANFSIIGYRPILQDKILTNESKQTQSKITLTFFRILIIVVIEYVDKELYEILGKAGRLTEERARVIACDLVSALYYLHSNRVLHRDLKPQNVLLEANGIAKLCDFGFARSMSTGTHVLTSIKGTPLYMAPELIEVCPYDHNADLWSLGCIIYELIVGTPPFQATSILHLVRLIRFEAVKWPDFISPTCKSFLQGLLQKDSSQRLTWPDLFDHPFVKGRILLIGESAATPFTTPLSASQALAKQQQLQSLAMRSASRSKVLERAVEKIHEQERKLREQRHRTCMSQPRYPINQGYCHTEPRRHYQALRRSEPSGTDSSASVDVLLGNLSFRASLRSDLLAAEHAICDNECPMNEIIRPLASAAFDERCRDASRNDETRTLLVADVPRGDVAKTLPSVENIGDGSVKGDWESPQKSRLSHDYEQEFGKDEDNIADKQSRLRDWDPSLVERHIEKEEWVAFLQRSMEEVMEGEIDSLLQENCVSVFVSPLRNPAAGCRVVEYVACLLSLPFVNALSRENIEKIERVYLDVRVVPNLVYAMKLMMSVRSEKNESGGPPRNAETRLASALSADELQAFESSMLVLCRLVYARQLFLTQFCDAVYIVNGISFLQQLLSLEKRKARIVGDLIAVLNNILRSQPENAELVERVVVGTRTPADAVELFDKLLNHRQSVIRSRTCTLVRLLGRFCCRALQQVWGKEMRHLLESVARDDDAVVRNAAEDAVNELKQLIYYNQQTSGE